MRTQFHVFPKMAHAELDIVHPEEFCRYAEELLMQEDRIWNGKKSFAALID